MVYNTQKEKEDAVYDKINVYLRQGDNKSVAVRKVMAEFYYATECAIYNIIKRVEKRREKNG